MRSRWCDISISLATGQAPLFFSPFSHGSLCPLPELSEALDTIPHPHVPPRNSILGEIWRVLRRFSVTVSEALINHRKLSDQTLLDTMASTMYRLLNMAIAAGSTDQTFQLAMLRFGASAFLPWRQLQPLLFGFSVDASNPFKA
jgi:hypothetical protein